MLLYEIVCKCSARTPSAPVVCGFTFTCEWWRWWGGGWGGGRFVSRLLPILSLLINHIAYIHCVRSDRGHSHSLSDD